MKRKNTARNALITSILSLLLCVSMLVGATFAWFTDEVTTGMNTIAAGNLDIELLANGAEVDTNTKLFNEVELWEPGVVVYENLQVANVGNLALKYQMSLNFGEENDLNGHKLSEVLKVAVIDKVADGATREEVLALAQGAIADDQGLGALSNFYLTGALAPKGKTEEIDGVTYTDKSKEMTVVVFWAPNDNEIDNLYNANNDQKTSDGKPLHIDFGVNLQATQLMYEDDSFGNNYDEGATILPKATVNSLPGEDLAVVWGIGGPEGTLKAPFKMQFQPNETYEEALAGQYGKYHADFVVYADRDVPAGTMALAGFYNEWCQMIDGKWVALRNDGMAIKAGEQIRLVAGMVDGMSVNYEEICHYGNDGTGFLCTAADLTGANAGTTITVELRLYETLPYGHEEHDLGDGNICHGNTANCETSNYSVVGTYTYTFPGAAEYVEDAAEFTAALASAEPGSSIFLAPEVDYGTIDISSELTDVTIVGAEDAAAIVNITADADLENVTLKNFGFEYTGATADCGVVINADAQIDNLVIDGCSFTGTGAKAGRGLSGKNDNATIVLKNCTFKDLGYPIYAWGGYEALTVENCTFDNIKSWAIMPQSGFNGDLTVTGCTFENCLGGGLIKAGTLTAGHTFTFTNNTVTGCTIAGDHNWFQFNASAGTSVISGNTMDGAAWTPGVAEGLK